MSMGEGDQPRGGVITTFGPQRPSEVRSSAVAVVVHLTDLHLDPPVGATNSTIHRRLVDQALSPQKANTFAKVATAAQRLLRTTGDRRAWRGLPDLVRDIVAINAASGTSVLVVQTGDVEAFGEHETHGFRGYQQLEHELLASLRRERKEEEPGVTVHEVYGNHDIWPPAAFGRGFAGAHADGPGHLIAAHEALLDAQSPLAPPWKADDAPCPDGVTVRVHRVDTIDPKVPTGAFAAQGRISAPPATPEGEEPILAVDQRLVADVGSGPKVIDLVLSHHPLLTGEHLKGKVHDVEPVRTALERRAIVLSGHRHRRRPVARTTPRPLPQLESSSPTVVGRWRPAWSARRREERGKGACLSVYYVALRAPEASETGDVVDRVRIDRQDFHPLGSQSWTRSEIIEDVLSEEEPT